MLFEELGPLRRPSACRWSGSCTSPAAPASDTVGQLHRPAEELDPHHRRLPALPRDLHLRPRRMRLDQLTHICIQQARPPSETANPDTASPWRGRSNTRNRGCKPHPSVLPAGERAAERPGIVRVMFSSVNLQPGPPSTGRGREEHAKEGTPVPSEWRCERPGAEGGGVRGAPRRRAVRDPESVGRRLRACARRTRFPGAGDDELRLRLHARPSRRRRRRSTRWSSTPPSSTARRSFRSRSISRTATAPMPASCARAIARVAEAGAVGGSIEDYDPDGFLYEPGHAVERIAAAAETAHGLGFPFMLTARAENHIRGNPDLDDTIARLQSFEAAGADVLYAPGLRTRRRHPRRVRRGVEAGERARTSRTVARGDRRRRRAARERRRRTGLGRGQGARGRGDRDPRRRRSLRARRAGAAGRMVRRLAG